ncbi:MAG: hypothetical protein ACK5LZ_02130 [Anaerorhabdus sp.]
MLKLIKHEILGAYRSLGKIYLVGIILSIVGAIAIGDYNARATEDLQTMIFLLTMLGVLGIFVAIYVWIITNFYRSMYKKPGYLTLTLPYDAKTILGSKLIVCFIIGVITGIFATICIMIFLFPLLRYLIISLNEMGMNGTELFMLIVEGISFSSTFAIQMLNGFVTSVLSFMFPFALMTFVQTQLTKKMRFLWGLAFVVATTWLSGIIYRYIIWPMVSSLSGIKMTEVLRDIATTEVVNNIAGVNLYLGVEALVGVIYIAILFFGTVYFINHKIELD